MRISDWSSDVCSSDLTITALSRISGSATATIASASSVEIYSEAIGTTVYQYTVKDTRNATDTAQLTITTTFSATCIEQQRQHLAEPDAARGHDDTNDGILWELGNQRFDSRGCCRFRDSRERPGGRPGHHSAQGLFGDAGRGQRRRSFAGLFVDRPFAGAPQAPALPSHRPAATQRPALWQLGR